MNASMWTVVILVAAVAGLALWLRQQGESAPTTAPPPAADLDTLMDADEDDAEWELEGAAAVTVDGLAFIGEEHGVSLVPTPDPLAPAAGPIVPMEFLRPGDLTAARVVRGAPSTDPWRLELLGRDGEYMAYAFEVEEAARAALDLIEERVMARRARGEEGPVAPSAEQFEEAKRRHDETIRLLSLGEMEGGEPLH